MLKHKLVSLNITKDNYLTILPLPNKNSDFEFETVPTENITNQEISVAPVNRFQGKGTKIIIVYTLFACDKLISKDRDYKL